MDSSDSETEETTTATGKSGTETDSGSETETETETETESETGSESGSETEQDNKPAKTTNIAKTTNTAKTKAPQTKFVYVPPERFTLVTASSTDDRSNPFSDRNLAGKELWFITAPIAAPLSKLTAVNLADVAAGVPTMQTGSGKQYCMRSNDAEEEEAAAEGVELAVHDGRGGYRIGGITPRPLVGVGVSGADLDSEQENREIFSGGGGAPHTCGGHGHGWLSAEAGQGAARRTVDALQANWVRGRAGRGCEC